MNSRNVFWEQLDLPGESFPGDSLIEIMGTERVLIENHCGVCAYSRERIDIKVKKGIISVSGACLELRCMTKDQLIISGQIQCISLNCRR